MRHAARLTLFMHDRTGKLDPQPDLAVLQALLDQVPLISNNPDGSRVLVYDLDEPADEVDRAAAHRSPDLLEALRDRFGALAEEARALSLARVATLAEVAEILIGSEVDAVVARRLRC